MATKIVVSIPDEIDYAVRVGSGVIDALGRNVRDLSRFASVRDVLVITDSNVGPLYLERVRASLRAAGFRVADIVLPAGESSKSLDVAGEIWEAMAQLGFGRDCLVVSLGGGVVGDLAAFVAACYMRGVPVVHVPTTLLAMVDSSVGGKAAVNLAAGKNLVGAFHQPAFVCADTDTLKTLPDREWRCGCGEVAKSAVIDSDDFFFWLYDHAADLSSREETVAAEAVRRCIVFKAGVVARDKDEISGVRECLNYGHTLGHAIEAACGYGEITHGAAIAEGMRFVAHFPESGAVFSSACGESGSHEGSWGLSDSSWGGSSDGWGGSSDDWGISPDFAKAQDELLDALGLERLAIAVSPQKLLAAMRHDKKTRGGHTRFVVLKDVAQWSTVPIPDAALEAHLENWFA